MKQRILLALLVAGLISFVGIGVSNVVKTHQKVQLQDVQLQDKSTQIKQLQLKYNVLNQNLDNELKQKTVNEQKVQELEKQKQELEQKTQQLNTQLQSKINKQNTVASAASKIASAVVPQVAAAGGCGDNQYANYIYMHESGCNLNAVNAIGCRGIGQACPGSKLPCGADYACQNAFFTAYAVGRYGSWQAAYNFWVANKWW